MPNWCHQTMTIAGNRKQLRKFLKDTVIKNDDATETEYEKYDLNRLVPLDPRASVTERITYHKGEDGDVRERDVSRFADMERDGFDGYKHAIQRWGTKWGACDVRIVSNASVYPTVLYFESAWSPAIPLLQEISKQYPGLGFAVYFVEETGSYGGWVLINDGDVVDGEDIDAGEMSPEVEALWDKYHEAEVDGETDEDSLYDLEEAYENARVEWLDDLYGNLHIKTTTCLEEFLVWKKKAERQRKAGRFVESFLPSV